MVNHDEKSDADERRGNPSLRVGGSDYVVLSVPEPSLEKYEDLTEAECAVCRAIYGGATDREIADARGTSVNTVANQTKSVFEKLEVGSRAELVAKLAVGGEE